MHKLFYTAAIPLLVGSAMAMEFTDTIEEGASSHSTTPVEEKNDDSGTVLRSGMLPNTSAGILERTLDQVNVSSMLALITLADATQSTSSIPNLAAEPTEEEDLPPLLEKVPSGDSDDESSEKDDTWGEYQESIVPTTDGGL